MIRPLGARLLIERLGLPDKTESGLWVIGREYPTLGIVKAAGRVSGRHLRDRVAASIDLVEAGDWVWFETLGVVDTREVGKDLFLVDWARCYGVIKEPGSSRMRMLLRPGLVLVKPSAAEEVLTAAAR